MPGPIGPSIVTIAGKDDNDHVGNALNQMFLILQLKQNQNINIQTGPGTNRLVTCTFKRINNEWK